MYFAFITRAFCAIVLLGFSAGAAAAAAPSAPTPTPDPLPPIAHVVTSDRQQETLENAARTTYVVTKAEIARRGFRTVAEAIEDLPGVTIQHYGGVGSQTGFGIRGSTSNQVLVLIDGIPAAGVQDGVLDLNSMPTSGVRRIEVVEGGGSTLYGTGSIGGIINVITAARSAGTSANLRAGSFGERDLRIETPHVSFERAFASNAFSLPDGTSRSDSDSSSTAARVAFERQLGHISAQFSANIVDHHVGTPGALPATFSSPTRQNTVDQSLLLSLSQQHPHARTTLELGADREQLWYYCINSSDPNCFTPNGDFSSEGRTQLSLRNSVQHERSRLVYGLDLARGVARLDDGAGDIAAKPFAQSALYLQHDWVWKTGSSVYAGLRGERDGALGGVIAPSLGGILQLRRGLTFKANFATAFRAPTVEDLYFPNFSNPNLRPERTRVADATLIAGNLLGGASIGWFTTAGSDLIVVNPAALVYPPPAGPPPPGLLNIGHAIISGMTFSLRTIPLHTLYAKLNLTDLYRAQNLDAGADGVRIAGRGPVIRANFELGSQGTPGSLIESAGIIADVVGPRGAIDVSQPAFLQQVGYTRLDGFLRVRLRRDALLSIRGYNLGNERYSDVYPGYPMPGRSFLVELSSR
ncbi:MAG: TonB-dependent receptor [Candidatus Eremiobacteraeota bacterium]|nr:TonB-dependent receptor [Candidatus Eremiobacteraeota bacterium]